MKRLGLRADGRLSANIAGTPGTTRSSGRPTTTPSAAVGGDDTLSGAGGNDSLLGGDGDDVLEGGKAATRWTAAPGTTGMFLARGGANTFIGDEGVDILDCDALPFRVKVDLVAETATRTGRQFHTVSGVENVIGTRYRDHLVGDDSDNRLGGRDGADSLFGGAGDDTLVGGRDDDRMKGGDGADTFIFTFVREHAPHGDTIVRLRAEDVIDLSAIDADKQTDGDQAFHLVDELGDGRGELALRWVPEDGVTYLEGQFGPGGADFTVILTGKHDHFDGIVLRRPPAGAAASRVRPGS